jgi:isopenicillin N synthase-like dioxygenase
MKAVEEYLVTTEWRDAAAEIQKSSFAVLQVSPKTAGKLTQAWREAFNLMHQTPQDGWTKLVDGHLHGYHVPSRAKRLFRAFPYSTAQPWPNQEFRRISLSLADDLHEILTNCLKHLQELNTTASTLKCKDDESFVDHEQPCKKPRLDPSSTLRQSSHILRIDPARCPMDYFLYNNQESKAINCSEHVDRGLLIAVSLTDVPGLEVKSRSRLSKENIAWICPEIRVHNSRLYREAADSSISDYICIMSGGQLAASIGADVPPCVHRVRQKLKRSRLSISYELRRS